MEFRLLGLFEVREDGRAVELPRGKERALLAVLLLHADEPVSTDRLVEELWEERPPANAAKTVQVYVSRLRKSVGATRLQTTPAGYALQVGPNELDSLVFERLARDGREALADGDPKTAQRLFSEALALWRGPALADFRFESFAQAEVRRLEELRAAAAADLIDARLAQGEVDAVIGELEALVEEHALWERPRGQLMLALYRAGRQADALELYRKTRALFAEELGIEPSPELQALERAILNQDKTLAAPESPTRRAVARRGSRLLLAGGLLLLAAAATAAVLVATRGSSRISSLAPDSIGVIDAASLRITKQLSLAGRPTRLGADGGSVWVGGDEAGTLSAVDAANGSVSGVVAPSGFPSDVAVGEGAVWVADGESGLLAKVDPTYRSVARRVRVAPRNLSYDRSRESLDPTAVAAGLGSVWTTDGSRWLTRLDPKTLTVDRTDLGSPLGDVAVGDGAIWAISGPAATVFRLDRDGRVTGRIPIASQPDAESPYPIGIAAGAGLVWVLNANTATVTKIDPAQGGVAATIQLGVQRRPFRLAAGDGAAWVADGDGTLARIDATTDQVQIVSAAGSLGDVAVVGKTIWVTAGAGPGGAAAKNVASSASAGALPASSCSPIYYESGTRPQYLIVGDLTLQGSGSALVSQTAEAVQFILKQHRFHAGRYVVGYQSCDNSTIASGGPVPAKCAANARAYAADPSVIGIIGTSSSNCSLVELPIANSAPDGPLAMVSPGDTYVGLTHHGPGTAPDEPARYYPTGTRSYVRLMAADDAQGAADALAARRLGAKRVFVLEDTNTPSYSAGIAADFARAARRLGLTVVGPTVWNYEAKSYTPFVTRVARSHPDAVFLGTFFFPGSVRLIKDLRSALSAGALLMAPDGFVPSDLVTYGGAAAEGMTASVAGLPTEQLPARGRRFVEDFEQATGNTTPTVHSIAAAQATEVLLDAIARSDGTRASVVKQLFRTRVTNGILGTFSFDRNGDTTAGAVTVYRITHGSPHIFAVITPPAALVH